MDLKKLERLAASGAKLPEKLTNAQALFFLEIRALYFILKNNGITKDDAKKEKREIETLYQKFCIMETLFKNEVIIHNRINKLIAPSVQIDALSLEDLRALFKKVIATIEGFE